MIDEIILLPLAIIGLIVGVKEIRSRSRRLGIFILVLGVACIPTSRMPIFSMLSPLLWW